MLRLKYVDFTHASDSNSLMIISRKGQEQGYDANFFRGLFDTTTYALIAATVAICATVLAM